MAHAVESMFSVRVTPWHTLGTILRDAPPTAAEAMKAAGLDWTVRKEPLYLADKRRVGGMCAHVREDNGRILGVASEGCKILQNSEAFEFFNPLLERGDLQFETAGALHNGRVVWVMARLNTEIHVRKNDVVLPYLLLSNAHERSQALEIRYTAVRVVCANTLSEARSARDIDTCVRITHTGNMAAKMDAAGEMLKLWTKESKALEQTMRRLAQRKINEATARAFVAELYPYAPKRDVTSQRGITTAREEVLRLYTEGEGAVPGTAWGIYNAATEFSDHSRVIPNIPTRRGADPVPVDLSEADALIAKVASEKGVQGGESRVSSVLFKSGATSKARAWNLALALV